MADFKSSWEETILPLVKEWAEWRFAHWPDKEDRVADAISMSWQGALTAGPDVKPKSIVWYAIKRVLAGRQFLQSVRSIDGPRTAREAARRTAMRETLDVNECLIREGDDPAEIAGFILDFAAWVESLNDKQRHVMERLAVGDRTEEAAKTCRLSPARISQYRRELKASYTAFVE